MSAAGPVPPDALRALRETWGYDAFRPGQDEAVTAVFARHDTLAVLPTGGGKSLIYQVPAVAWRGLVLVVSPLVALMTDQVDALRQRGVRAVALHAGLSTRQVDQAWTDAEHGLYRLVYLTPERLESDLFQARAPRLAVDLLAVDEAHCISEWGHDFRPAYRRIADARPLLTDAQGRAVPILAVTATATPPVRRDIVEQLGFRNGTVIVRGFDRPALVWSVHHVQDPKQQVLDVFRGVPGAGLLYAGTRRATESWARQLSREGIQAEPYHAGLEAEARDAVQRRWLGGETRVIAATSAFGMGIDKADVRAVVHVAPPLTLEAYYQEAGRAGRDGQTAYAALVLGPDAERVPRALLDVGHPTADDVQAVYAAAGSLAQIALGSLPDGPVSLDVKRLAHVAGQPVATVRAAVDHLAEVGVWSLVRPREGQVELRVPVGRDRLIAAASAESPQVQSFVESVLRTLPPDSPTEWTTVRADRLAKATDLPADRLRAGLDYLAQRGLVDVRDPSVGLVLDWKMPRGRHAPVDAPALDRARRLVQARFDEVVRYATSVGCRRQHLLTYFGEPAPSRCGRCDVCLGRHRPTVVEPSDEPALVSILQAVERGERPAGPDAPRRQRELADWLVHEGLLRLADPLAVRFELTPRGQRHLETTAA